MFISDFAIRRPIITIVTMIALVVFGIAALVRLQTDEFPDIDAPIVFIGIAYPGASPDQVEREVVNRLEDRISGISGLDILRSTSTDGFAQIIVQFTFGKPVDQATQDVRDAISAVRAQLPTEIIEPIVQRFDPSSLPIVSLALTSLTLTPAQLTQIADQTIASDLRAIPGAAQVNVVGADSATLNVILDPARLTAAGVGVDQVVNAVRSQNLAAPVGQVIGPVTERAIRLEPGLGHDSCAEHLMQCGEKRDGAVIAGPAHQVHIRLVELEDRDHLQDVRDVDPVGSPRALRMSRGARRVDHRRREPLSNFV